MNAERLCEAESGNVTARAQDNATNEEQAPSHGGRKSFVLPKLTVTALRAPKNRQLPAVVVAAPEASDPDANVIAPFKSNTLPSPPRSTRRTRAVVFSQVATAAAAAAAVNESASGTAAHDGTSLLKPATLETPAVVSQALEDGVSNADSEAMAEFEDVLAILHWLAHEHDELGDAGYQIGLEKLRSFSHDAMSSPIPLPARETTHTDSTAKRQPLCDSRQARQRSAKRHSARPPMASSPLVDGASVVLREVIVIRIPRTVAELPSEEKTRRWLASQHVSASSPALAGPRGTSRTTPDADTIAASEPHAVVVMERGRGIVALHVVELPLHSIPASVVSCNRAQENLVEVIRSQCPEAFCDAAGASDVTTDASGGGQDASRTLRSLKRPTGRDSPQFDPALAAQPFSALCPSFTDSRHVLNYDELKAHLAGSASRVGASPLPPPPPPRTSSDSAGFTSAATRTTRGDSRSVNSRPPGDVSGHLKMASAAPPRTFIARVPASSPGIAKSSSLPRPARAGRDGTHASRSVGATGATSQAAQRGGFDPVNPAGTSPFVQQSVMPLAYDATGELVLRPR